MSCCNKGNCQKPREEMLDMGTFAFHPEDKGELTKRSQHSVYAFCEQFFEQV